jgi:hypothetical protein
MAGKPYPEFFGASYRLADTKAAIQSAINCHAEKLDADRWRMVSIPGEVEIANYGAEIRNQRNVDGRWFVVAGNTLYEQQTDGTNTNRGTLASTTGFVGMANNKTQLAIVDGANLYIYNLTTNALTEVASAAWRGSDDVWEMDGYFIFVDPDTDQFYLSAIDDGTNLDALDFSSADSAPDNILAHCVSHRQALFFGDLSGEFWINSGGSAVDFPFVRYQSYTLDVGIVGKHALVLAADTVFWVGKTRRGSGIVYMLSGNQPQRVSTIAVEKALAASSDLSAATMWSYQSEGHEFVGINAPGLETTWVYDAALQMWAERGEWDGGWQPIRSKHHIAFDGATYAGDDFGSLLRLDETARTLNGRVLVRERTWPHIVSGALEPVNFYGLELACTTGEGGAITLQISNDSGRTFGPPLIRYLGAIGQWMTRVRWLGLGSALNRVFRIRCSDPIAFSITDATIDAS